MRLNESFHTFLLSSPIKLIPVIKGLIQASYFPAAIGRPFAFSIFMILVNIRMNVLSEKRMELSQTIASLSGSIRMEKGCQRCDFCQSIEDENRLFLLEEWDTQKNLMTHMKSEQFRVLRGTMSLLREPYEMMIHTVFHPEGMEVI